MRAERVWVIGLDGAPWSLIRPWAEAGELPVLHTLMQNGAWGDLESTIQPLTPCAWSTFLTGTNPGQHGLFDFTRRIPGSYQVEVVNAACRRGRSLWDVLSHAGRRVGVINVPMTYPPEPVNGFLVAGLDTPGLHSPFTYPETLAAEIAGRHIITVSTAGVSHAEYLLRTLEAVDRRFEVLHHLLRREAPDFLMKVVVETDAIQHCSWHLLSQPDAPSHDAILQVYRRVDWHLGELLAEMPPATTLILMSDHGAGPLDKVVYLDRWLARQGWLCLRRRDLRADLMQRAVGLGQRYLPSTVKAWLRGQEGARAQVESTLRFGAVDWDATQAFAWGNQGNINLNLKSREPQGTVQPGAEAERLTTEIIAALYELCDPDTGEPVVDKIYRREELYHGPMTELAPDLLIRWRDDRYVAKTLYERQGTEIFGHKLAFGRAGSVYTLEQTGTHTMQGICLFYGAGVPVAAHLVGARLLDLPPTILRLLDVPIPEQMEGHVLMEAAEAQGQPMGKSADSKLPVAHHVSCITPHGSAISDPRSPTSHLPPLRVQVLGLDGATWDLLGPWIEAGYLPHLAALRVRSAWGRLRSTTPPFSAAAWATFASGVNPGAHGIFDFWVGHGEARRPIGSDLGGVPALWDRLSRAGRRVAVINVPVTYPPRPVNGVVISGMLTPSEDANYTYPPELKAQLQAAVGVYRANPYAAITQSKAFLKEAFYWVEQRERANQWLLEREPWDCFISVIQAPDPIQHYFWTFLQATHADYHAPDAAAYRALVLEVFQCIDALIGRRLAALDERTVLLLVSDHGAGEATHWFHLNHWLLEQGLLALKDGTVKRRLRWGGLEQGQVLDALRRLDVLNLRGRVNNLARQRWRQRVDRLMASVVDWGRTRAYAGSPSAEAIYINLAGRESEGVVQPGIEYEQLRAAIAEQLLALRGPDGEPVVEAVHYRESIYHGPYLDQAPDLVLEIGRRPYLISENLSARHLFERIPFRAARGRHRPEGILLAHGPAVGAPGMRSPARIEDLTPTILHLLGLPVPAELDGRVLVDWLEPAWAAGVTYTEPAVAPRPPVPPAGFLPESQTADYSAEDIAAIEERLRSLGYLD